VLKLCYLHHQLGEWIFHVFNIKEMGADVAIALQIGRKGRENSFPEQALVHGGIPVRLFPHFLVGRHPFFILGGVPLNTVALLHPAALLPVGVPIRKFKEFKNKYLL